MIKSILVISALVAVSLAYNEAPVYTLSQGPEVVTLEPGVPVTTGFNQYSIGSQFRIFLPNNISTVSITWTRSAAVSGCSSSAWARLYGKWGTWPCSANAYSFNSELCEDRVDFGYSASSPLVVNLNADNSKYLDYWDSTNNNDFLRGDYLYLASWLDTQNQNCTATINVTLDYCPDGTIAAEGPSTSPQCVAVTNITASTHTETVIANGPFDKFWLVHVPQNASGIRASITQTNITSLYLYGRVSSAAIQSNYYSNYASGSGSFSYWWANPPAGDFVITVHTASGSPNIVFDIAITVQSCPAGFSSDDYGNCTFPLTTLASPYDLTTPISVDIPASPTSSDCNWRVYALPIPAWTYTFFNVSVTETAGSSAYVSLRKNAWPTKNIYDDLSQTNYKWTFTPDDFYINTTTWWYLGFCNPSSSEASSWTLSAAYSALPSPSPVPVSPSPVVSRSPSPAAASSSPSASPSTGASHSPVPSASSSPGAGSDSSASATVVSVLVILAALVVLF